MGVIPVVVLLYVVLTPVSILTYCIGHTAIPAPYTVYNTTRVGIHICVYTQGKGVGVFMARTQSSTLGLYIQIYIKIYKGPH